MPRWKRFYLFYDSLYVLRFGGKYDILVSIVSVVKRSDTDGVSCCYKFILLFIVNYTGKLGIKDPKEVFTKSLI